MTHQPDGPKNQEDPGPQNRMPSPPGLPQGMGALSRSRDKFGQESSESRPWSYLGRCQQMAPMLGSQVEVPEAGREEHIYVCKHTHVGVGVTGVMTTQPDMHK